MRLGTWMTYVRGAAVVPAVMLLGLLGTTGCETSGLADPGEMMRVGSMGGKPMNLMVPILNTLDAGRDEQEPEFTNARDVRQADLKWDATDYVIGRNDLLSISISEVAGPGVESVKTSRVSESGMVSLPLIGTVKASGLTEAELEKAVAQVYRDKNLIQNAQVSVTVIEARQRTFSILGVVSRPGQYQIVQSDFRVWDALTLAGDVQVQGIDYMYVLRKTAPNPDRPATKPAGTTPATDTPKKPVDPLEGKRGAIQPTHGPVHLAVLADGDTKDESGERKIMVDGKWVPVKSGETPAKVDVKVDTTAKPVADPLAPAPKTDTVPATVVTPATPGTVAAPEKGFAFDEPKADTDVEIIRVPLSRLQAGDLQYNIVIRANDTIIVPGPKVGEYYMGGHVNRTGVYSLTGRQITLKQAIISAGMIDGLGWPERTEVIRRVGKDKELFVRVDLPKIFAGQQPDIYLRPYDVVNVGTNAIAPFLGALRGAFRFTYGFGFIYDRNYYNQPTGTSTGH